MPTDELFLQLLATEDGPQLHVADSPLGPGAKPRGLPVLASQARLVAKLEELDKLLLAYVCSPKCPTALQALSEAQEEVGRELFDQIFDSTDPFTSQSLTLANSEPVPIRMAWDPRDDELNILGALPWELLYQQEPSRFLARARSTPVSRFLTIARRARRDLNVDLPLKILLAPVSPEDGEEVRADEEMAAISRALNQVDGVEVHTVRGSIRAIQDAILRDGFHVVHIMGHGGFNPATGVGWLVLEDDDRKKHRVRGEILADFLSSSDLPSLRLVVLSSCYGATMARQSGLNALAAVAPALCWQGGVPAVVAMQAPITESAAIVFTQRLYERLVARDPIDVAVATARQMVAADPAVELEWPTPAVFTRVRDGRIMPAEEPPATETSDARKHSTRLGVEEKPPVTVCIRSFGAGWAEEVSQRADKLIEFQHLFSEDGREIKDPASWKEIVADLRRFLRPLVAAGRPIDLVIPTHASIAFTAGLCLEAKSGLTLRIWQPSQDGSRFLSAQDDAGADGSLWELEEYSMDAEPDIHDVALAVSVSQPILDDVRYYLTESGAGVGRLIEAEPVGGYGSLSVENGTHALLLAQQLVRKLRQRTVPERKANLHLFLACPNIVSFYVGQLSGALGRIQLYEHPFKRPDAAGMYFPSIRLPWSD